MTERSTRAVVCVAAPVLAVAIVLLATLVVGGLGPLLFVPLVASCTAVGALIWYRRANGVMAALFLSSGLAVALTVLTQAVADTLVAHHAPGARWAAWAFQSSLSLTTVFYLLVQLFPTGRPLTSRWRVLVAATVGIGGVLFLTNAFGVTPEFRANFPGIPHPLPFLPDGVARGLDNLGGLGTALVFLASAAEVVVRFRRSSGEGRLQMKWFALGAAVAAVGFAVGLVADPNGSVIPFALLAPLLPLSAGAAILRYRLYDIDVVVSKALVVAGLAVFIALAYVGVVVGLGAIVGAHDSPGLSIAATVAIALLFAPIRAWVRRFANRLVYGERATPYEVMAGFSRRVADTLSVDQVLPGMAEAAATGVGASVAQVRVLVASGERAERWPLGVEVLSAWDRSLEIAYRGEPVGGVDVTKPANDPLSAAEIGLLEDLASQAGLALHNVRLTDDLALRTRELAEQTERLAASRQRLVAARDEQRRRLEREISAGPAAELGRIRGEVDLVAEMADGDPDGAAERLETLLGRSNATLEQLRDIARGIFPPLLVDQGVVPALEAHIRKVGANVGITASPAFASRRFDADVEACLYFCSLQAIQNVLRHAGNAPTTVRFEVTEGAVIFEVTDDGPGFDPSTTEPGMGQAIMRDRIDALDGALEVRSEPGRGTVVEGRVPLRVVTPA